MIYHLLPKKKNKVEEYRIKFLSKKGIITALFDDFKSVPAEMKKEMGQRLNELRNKAQDKINDLKANFENEQDNAFKNDGFNSFQLIQH